jgi:hypothetical protein
MQNRVTPHKNKYIACVFTSKRCERVTQWTRWASCHQSLVRQRLGHGPKPEVLLASEGLARALLGLRPSKHMLTILRLRSERLKYTNE